MSTAEIALYAAVFLAGFLVGVLVFFPLGRSMGHDESHAWSQAAANETGIFSEEVEEPSFEVYLEEPDWMAAEEPVEEKPRREPFHTDEDKWIAAGAKTRAEQDMEYMLEKAGLSSDERERVEELVKEKLSTEPKHLKWRAPRPS